jgi:uncharacterized protein (DUF885 family)
MERMGCLFNGKSTRPSFRGLPETNLFVMSPRHACASKVGMLKILELRAKAQKALGGKFSIKQFHNVVLRAGNVPLALLEQGIDEQIAMI